MRWWSQRPHTCRLNLQCQINRETVQPFLISSISSPTSLSKFKVFSRCYHPPGICFPVSLPHPNDTQGLLPLANLNLYEVTEGADAMDANLFPGVGNV